MELKKIYSKVKHKYKGKMIRFKGRNIDTIVTPNHKFPIVNKNNKKIQFITAQEIFDSFQKSNSLSHFYIPKTSKVKHQKIDYFTLKGCDEFEFSIRANKKLKNKYMEDVKIPMDVFMSFMGIYLSEGHVSSSSVKHRKGSNKNGKQLMYESSDNGYSIGISQRKEEVIILIEELLNLLPFKIKKYKKDNGLVSFIINDKRLWNYLYPLGKAKFKYIPSELKKLPPEYLEYLLKWFRVGDGRTIGKYSQTDVFSTSQKLINNLQEILIKTGNSGNIRKEFRRFDRFIKEDNGNKRLIKGENSNDMWFLNFSKPQGIYLDNRNLKITEEDFDDYVYSVDVPNHTYYVRSNNKCHWTGNSSLLDLDRISHSILETWWEGKTLMGKIKIFTSPGWRKMGIVSTKGDQAAFLLLNGATLGISSRGIGSLKQIKGQNIVQEDFELVCFDLVSSPSTPGAYIFSDINDKIKYQESIEEKPMINDKMVKLMNNLDRFLKKN